MFRKVATTFILLPVALAVSGCFWVTTKDEGHAIRNDIQHLDDRLGKIEDDLEDERNRLVLMVDRARTDVEKLEDTLSRATRVLSRNSADFGAEMESVKNKLMEIDGALAELRHEVQQSGQAVEKANQQVKDFAMAAGVDMPVDESTVPDSPEAHFAMIQKSYTAGRHGEVRSLCKLYLSRYTKDTEADQVQMMIARTYLKQKRWANALGELRKLTDEYPKSDLTPEVLYEMANAFFALGDCTDARILIEAVKTKHKRSPFAKKATDLGEKIQDSKNLCTS